MKVRDPERSDHIIETAAVLFGEFGYGGVRMEDIAARAGVAKGTLYLYFKDKDDLFLALILRRMNDLFEQIQSLAATESEPADKLRIVVRKCIDYFSSQPHIFAVIERLDHTGSPAQTEALRTNRERFLRFTAGIIENLNSRHGQPVISPDTAARILCSMMRELMFQPPPANENLSDQIVQVFLHGICPSGVAVASM